MVQFSEFGMGSVWVDRENRIKKIIEYRQKQVKQIKPKHIVEWGGKYHTFKQVSENVKEKKSLMILFNNLLGDTIVKVHYTHLIVI